MSKTKEKKKSPYDYEDSLTLDTDIETFATDRAQTFLYMPHEGEAGYEIPFSGYTPTSAGYYKQAGEYYDTPNKGDIVYFNVSDGGIGHVGIVTDINLENQTFTTVEGNTSSDTFTNNGGVVASHTYDFSEIGGRVDGFGRPNYEAAGITVDEFIEKAEYYIGYEEKASNENLNSFHDNAGSNNFTKFESEVSNTSGSYWCQWFVDAVAKETITDKASKAKTALRKADAQEKMQQKETESSSLAIEDDKSQLDILLANAKDKSSDKLFEGISMKNLNKELDELTNGNNGFSQFKLTHSNDEIKNTLLQGMNNFDINNESDLAQMFTSYQLDNLSTQIDFKDVVSTAASFIKSNEIDLGSLMTQRNFDFAER